MSRNVKLGVSGVSLAILVAGCNLIAGLDEPSYDPSLDNPGSNLDGSIVGDDDDGSVAGDGSAVSEGGIADTGADGAKPGDTVLTIIAGKSGGQGYADGPAANARFNFPRGAVWDGGNLVYVADTSNDAIRVYHIDTKTVTTLVRGHNVVPNPWGVALVGRALYITANSPESKGSFLVSVPDVNAAAPTTRVVVGSFAAPSMGAADGPSASATLGVPKGLTAMEVKGNTLLLIADSDNAAVRVYDTRMDTVSTLVTDKLLNGVTSVVYSAARSRYEATSGNAIYAYDPDAILPLSKLSLVAGSATAGTANGTLLAAMFRQPSGLLNHASGDTYIADTGNNRIESINWGGGKAAVTTLVGDLSGSAGSADAVIGGNARFNQPGFITAGPDGGGFVVDSQNHTLRQITIGKATSVSTAAGRPPSSGSADGDPTKSLLTSPLGIAFEGASPRLSRTFVLSETPTTSSLRVCSLDKTMSSITQGGTGGAGTGVRTTALAFNPNDNLLYGAASNAGAYTTIVTLTDVMDNSPKLYAGSTYGNTDASLLGASFAHIYALAIDPPRKLIYVSDRDNGLVRKVDMQAQVVSTLAGKLYGQQVLDGPKATAEIVGPTGIAVDTDGNVYVAESEDENSHRQGHVIRKIDATGNVTTIAGQTTAVAPKNGIAGFADGLGTAASFNNPGALAFDGGHYLYVSDVGNHAIRRIDLAAGAQYAVVTVFGTPQRGAVIEGPAISAGVNTIAGIAFRGPNSLLMADRAENVLLELSGLKP